MGTFTAADGLSLARIPLAIALPVVAIAMPQARWGAVALFVAAVATDVADGWWARRTGSASRRGARLDSIADAFLTVGAAIALVATVRLPEAAWFWWSAAAVTALRLTVIVATWARHRIVSIMHTTLNRVTGVLLACVVGFSLARGEVTLVLVAAAALASIAASTEELALVRTTRPYDPDARGWRPVRRSVGGGPDSSRPHG